MPHDHPLFPQGRVVSSDEQLAAFERAASLPYQPETPALWGEWAAPWRNYLERLPHRQRPSESHEVAPGSTEAE